MECLARYEGTFYPVTVLAVSPHNGLVRVRWRTGGTSNYSRTDVLQKLRKNFARSLAGI